MMSSIEDKIKEIEEEIRNTPYNKATEQHIGRLKAKLAKLKEEKISKSKKSGGGKGYDIEKSGDATVILGGFPSVGKSTILNSLTNADSEVADYEFTTLKVIPGTLKYKGANIQILDVPGIISGAAEGRGRGREVISVLRNADLLVIIMDPFDIDQYEKVKEELHKSGIRLNQSPPKVEIRKRGSGGLDINSTVKLDIGESEMKSILNENGIINAEVLIRENLNSERFIDAVMGNRRYVPGFVIVNKVDLLDNVQLRELKNEVNEKIEEDALYVSARFDELDSIKEKIFSELNFIRIYLKPRGKQPDMDEPMILRDGATIEDLCRKIHRDMVDSFRHARVWGKSAKHPGQKLGKEHELEDGDIVTVFS